jgi:filamentous hemagglutinin
MSPKQRWLYFLAALAVAVVFGVARLGTLSSHPEPDTYTAGADRDAIVWSHGRGGAASNAEDHWTKHGGDFPEFHNAQEYERGALSFVTHIRPGTLTKRRSNGDTLFYDPATNTFAVTDSEGEPRTFFRPNSGRAYWDRQ